MRHRALPAGPPARSLRTRLLPVVLMLAACAGSAAGPWPPPPQTAGRAILPGGTILELEIADEPEERRFGLKQRPSFPDDRGMLFVLAFEGVHGFIMKDCLIPLDILWIDRHGRVLHVERDLPPCADEEDACPTWAPEVNARFVLELRGGGAALHGLDKGSVILFDLQ